MSHTDVRFLYGATLSSLEPGELQTGLNGLLLSYQTARSALRAWLVVHYAEALSRHPDFEGSDEQRCAYQRLARRWRWLATTSAEGGA